MLARHFSPHIHAVVSERGLCEVLKRLWREASVAGAVTNLWI
jgi:hypothetical protein